MTPLWKTKTFWVGVLTVAAGVVEIAIDGDWSKGGEKVLLGLAMITGRQALAGKAG